MPYQLSTWGKFEGIRKEMLHSLLEDNLISQVEKELETLLFTQVTTNMIEASLDYVSKHMDKWKTNPKELTIGSYQAGLGAVVSSVTELLNLSPEQKKLHLMPFIEKANFIIEELIDTILLIGKFSYQKKQELLIEWYGEDFSTLYPSLVGGVMIYDKEFSALIKNSVLLEIEKLASQSTSDIATKLKEESFYLDQIASQKNTNPAFEEKFRQMVGNSLVEYKELIRQQNDHPVCAI